MIQKFYMVLSDSVFVSPGSGAKSLVDVRVLVVSVGACMSVEESMFFGLFVERILNPGMPVDTGSEIRSRLIAGKSKVNVQVTESEQIEAHGVSDSAVKYDELSTEHRQEI